MTKEDRLFLTGLIKGLENRFDGLEGRFDGLEGRFDGLEGRFDGLENRMEAGFAKHDKRFESIDQRFDGLENRMEAGFAKHDKRFESMDQRFDGLEEKVEQNSRDIRFNGMQIELMREDINQIKEKDSFYDELAAKVDAIFEVVTTDIPAIKQAVSNHSVRIAALEAKCG